MTFRITFASFAIALIVLIYAIGGQDSTSKNTEAGMTLLLSVAIIASSAITDHWHKDQKNKQVSH